MAEPTNTDFDLWALLLDADVQGAITLGVFVLSTLAAGIWVIYKHFSKRDKQTGSPAMGRGGKGGNATARGGGAAYGGRGGRAGAAGTAGDGGDAHVDGHGIAVGGDGGDGGFPWRPGLGAPSGMERVGSLFGHRDGLVDEYGFYYYGRGGDAGQIDCEVEVDGRNYKLVPLLKLLRLWKPEVIQQTDSTMPATPQDFWNNAMSLDPEITQRALEHLRICEDSGSAPDPYVLPTK